MHMFTGIVETTGEIKKIEGNLFTISIQDYEITRSRDYEQMKIGESISVSGVCLTVIETQKDLFIIEIMEESRNRTTFGKAKVGDKLNLERSAKIGERNSGHFVTGHIDEKGKILDLKRQGDYWLFRISLSKENAKLVVEKGSISIDGISLTVSKVDREWFEVCIISHTWEVTNLSEKKVGDLVNIEFDILGKYILNALR